MKLLISSASVILGLIGKSLAHTIFQQVWVNGVDQGFEYAMRLPSYDGPQTDVTTTYMNCNGPPNDLLYNSTGVITASAGATMTGRWGQYLETNSPSVDPSHKGPIMVYMAPAGGNVGTIAPPHGGWFKIYEDGLHSDGTWAVDKMIANNGLWTWTIPSCIPSGQYFVRGEMIALHAASSYPGAQLYFECAQVSIINGGSATPSTVSFPGAYHTNDPGILYNLYAGSTTYTIPGPTVFACPGSGGTTKTPTTTPTTTPIKTTTPSTTTTTKTTTTGGSSGSCAALYGQCGGIGYTGGTCCSSGTCTVSNAYYSQCLP